MHDPARALTADPDQPFIIGIRHHSPACARLVKHCIEQLRPAWVLIEGPVEFNGRLDELFLPHQLPIALYSYCQFEDNDTPGVGAWTPFAEWSPEWQALQAAAAVGAQTRFIDLPVWATARTDDQRAADDEGYPDRQQALLQASGMETSDAFWDHLFEDEAQQADLLPALSHYFEQLRREVPGCQQDRQREAYMAAWTAWAMAQDQGPVLVVCGGWHAPVLANSWHQAAGMAEPACPEPAGEGAITGSYLTPYSEKRLDVLAGYLSGMPAPVWQHWCWQHGQRQAGENLLQTVLNRLRQLRLPASTADMAAAHLHAHAIAQLRGHRVPLRSDWLDAMTGALIKEALNVPLPWSYRGPLRAGTDPILVALVDVLAGDRFGVLAPDTPQPPLPKDVAAELVRAGIRFPDDISVNRFDATGLLQSQIMHRLAILSVPGIECRSGYKLMMSGDGAEDWQLRRPLQQHAALIEAARYGATLEQAARNRLEAEMASSEGITELAGWLNRAALAGLSSFSQQLISQLDQQIARESRFEALGPALEVLYALWREDQHNPMHGAPVLYTSLQAALDRILWLAESSASVATDQIGAHLLSWQVLCHILRDVQHLPSLRSGQPAALVPLARALAVLDRRTQAADAAALTRGAALGALIRLEHPAADAERALALLAHLPAAQLGEALHGLIALARHQLASHPAFIAGFSQQLAQLADDQFIIALPDLRAALAWLPPRERGALARQVLDHYQLTALPAGVLSRPLPAVCDAPTLIRHQQQETQALNALRNWGIL